MQSDQVKKFATGYNQPTVFFLIVIIVMIWAPLLIHSEEPIAVFIVDGLITALVLSILFGTYYYIRDKDLYYRCGPFRGKIDIMKIRKIEHDDHFIKTSLMKLGLSRKGFKIYYDKFNDVSVAKRS